MKKNLMFLISLCTALSVYAADIEREVQICNIVTQYLCILEDFQGRSYQRVRKEMEENLNTRKLQPETKRLVRRLSDACDLAETTLQNIDYTTEDSSDNSELMWGEHLGASGAMALAAGDPTPLILGIGRAFIKQEQLDKEKQRAIAIEMRTFNQMLTRYHMEVNERCNDLADEHNVSDNRFIHRSVYKEFLNASNKKGAEGINVLRRIVLEYPDFREAWYFYGKKLQAQKKYAEAAEAFKKVVDTKILVIRQDGLKGKALTEIGVCKYREGKYQEAIAFSDKALKMLPGYYWAHQIKSHALYGQGKYEQALKIIDDALALNPDSPEGLHHRAELLLYLNYSEDKIWQTIEKAFSHGLNPEYCWGEHASTAMANFMKRDKSIKRLTPKLSAYLEYGILYDDVILKNESPYPLTNVKIKINIYSSHGRLETNDGVVETTQKISRIDPNNKYKLINVFSIKNNAAADVVIEFSCDQSLASWKWSSVDKKLIRKQDAK